MTRKILTLTLIAVWTAAVVGFLGDIPHSNSTPGDGLARAAGIGSGQAADTTDGDKLTALKACPEAAFTAPPALVAMRLSEPLIFKNNSKIYKRHCAFLI